MTSDEELSEDQFDSQDTDNEQSEYKFIAERVKQYPEILEKSQLPAKKAKKQTAMENVLTEYRQLYGKHMTAKALLKKLGNMKTRLKKKPTRTKQPRTDGRRPLYQYVRLGLGTCEGDTDVVENYYLIADSKSTPTKLNKKLYNNIQLLLEAATISPCMLRTCGNGATSSGAGDQRNSGGIDGSSTTVVWQLQV
ncbi:hypothetical protein FQR65_LT09155 [Abscondita terminalis]|nr:hypothetical protein FQR65_LT09155 [Abscondita terminalis]